jgi:hypothetical protein
MALPALGRGGTMRLGVHVTLPRGIRTGARALCTPPGSAPEGGFFGRIRSALTDPLRQRSAEKMVAMRDKGSTWTEAAAEALRDMRKERKDTNIEDFYRSLSKMDAFRIEQLREQYQEGLAAEDKMTITQRMGLRFDQMRGGEQSEALEEMKGKLRLSLNIVHAMTPSERRNPLMLVKKQRTARRRIMAALDLDSDEPIKEVLMQYEWTLIQWEFIKRELAAGRPIPSTADELEWKLRQQPTSRAFHMLREQAERMQKRMRRASYSRPLGTTEALGKARGLA